MYKKEAYKTIQGIQEIYRKRHKVKKNLKR